MTPIADSRAAEIDGEVRRRSNVGNASFSDYSVRIVAMVQVRALPTGRVRCARRAGAMLKCVLFSLASSLTGAALSDVCWCPKDSLPNELQVGLRHRESLVECISRVVDRLNVQRSRATKIRAKEEELDWTEKSREVFETAMGKGKNYTKSALVCPFRALRCC